MDNTMPPESKKIKSNPEPVEIEIEDLTEVKEIGEGGFGTVFHMIWHRVNDVDLDVAAKRLFKVSQHELEVLSTLDHPNIVRFIGVVSKPINFMLILELCEGGSLRSYLRNNPSEPLPPDLLRSWPQQAARAIGYLQDMGVIHKDVKSDNYLIADDNILKLADFGLAKLSDKTINQATESGTAAYMAPELFTEGSLSPKFDIFAFGVVLWEIVTRKVPYEGKEHQVIVFSVCFDNESLQIPADCPADLANLMKQCWQRDRKKRPSIKEILSVLERQNVGVTPVSRNGTGVTKGRATTVGTCPTAWILQRQFAEDNISLGHGIAICPSGDVAVVDYGGARLKVYDVRKEKNGKLKFQKRFIRKQSSSLPYAVTVSSDGTYFVTDDTRYVKVIDGTCTDDAIPLEAVSLLPEAADALADTTKTTLSGITLDSKGDLLIGQSMKNKGFINTFTQNGDYLRSIKVEIQPKYLAVTPRDIIVVSSRDPEAVQLVNHNGQIERILSPPDGVVCWWPRGVCCSKESIFVCNAAQGNDTGIYCYTLSGEYHGCVIKDVTKPMDIALTDDGTTMMVVERDEGVKIFVKEESRKFGSSDDQTHQTTSDSETAGSTNLTVASYNMSSLRSKDSTSSGSLDSASSGSMNSASSESMNSASSESMNSASSGSMNSASSGSMNSAPSGSLDTASSGSNDSASSQSNCSEEWKPSRLNVDYISSDLASTDWNTLNLNVPDALERGTPNNLEVMYSNDFGTFNASDYEANQPQHTQDYDRLDQVRNFESREPKKVTTADTDDLKWLDSL